MAGLLCISLLLAFANAGMAADGMDILQRVEAAYKSFRSLKVEAVSRRSSPGIKNTQPTVVKLYTVADGRTRVETFAANRTLALLLTWDGRRLTEYRAWSNEYTRAAGIRFSSSFHPSRGTGWGEMTYESIAEDVRTASVKGSETLMIGSDRLPCTAIDVEYKTSAARYTFWISDLASLVLRRVAKEQTEAGFVTVDSRVRALTVNEVIEDSAFQFVAPKGAKDVSEPEGSTAIAAASIPYAGRPAVREMDNLIRCFMEQPIR
jgi:outer membrane lipoprotein-sorting protein